MYSQHHFPLLHRLLHWGLALTMMVMLLTVLLRMGWMGKNHMAAMIDQGLVKLGIIITDKQAVSIARAIRGVMFKWHVYFGYGVTGLVFARFIYMFKWGTHYQSAFSSQATAKQKAQAWVYWGFYAGVTTSVITGLLLDFLPHHTKTYHDAMSLVIVYFFLAANIAFWKMPDRQA